MGIRRPLLEQQSGKAKVMSDFFMRIFAKSPMSDRSSGQDGLFQTLYLQKWPKSGFEIVVRVERKKISAANVTNGYTMFPLVRRNPAAAAIP